MPTPFTIRGLRGEQTGILGIWEPVSPAPLSFSVTAVDQETDVDESQVVWSVSLPGDPNQARELVNHQAQALKVVQQSIVTSQSTLHTLAVDGAENLAFVLEQTAEENNPEVVLGRVDELFGGSNRSPRFYLGKTR